MPHDFRYISKHDTKVQEAYENLMQLLRKVHNDLRKTYTFQHRMVGSYARNMITYDERSNVGYDFDVNIYPNDDKEELSAKEIKLRFKEALDKYAKAHGFDYAEDSKRVLTIKVKDRKRARIVYSVDFAFVNDYEDDEGYERQRCILYKKARRSYTWEEQSDGFSELPEKVAWIKENRLWSSTLRPYYIKKKNANTDPSEHSRTVFAKAVNEICQKNGYCC